MKILLRFMIILIISFFSSIFSYADNITKKDDKLDVSILIESNDPVCEGQTLWLRFYGWKDKSCVCYWEGPNNFTATGDVVVIPDANASQSGVWHLTVKCDGYELYDNVAITIIPKGVGYISPKNGILCKGESLLLTAHPIGSYIWSTGERTQSIWVKEAGTYSVTATSVFGEISSDSINVIYPGNFITNQAICAGDTLTWDTQLGNNYNYTWQDESTLPFFNIYQAGEYSVLINDTNGCSFVSDTINITINNFEQIASLGNDTNLCTGNTIELIVGNNEAASFLWSDGTTNSHLIINQTGNYWVSATNNIGCIATDTIHVNVVGVAPIPNFNFNTTCIGKETQFNDLSTSANGNIIEWTWNFGDSNTSTIQNPIHLYNEVGDYTISLTITSENTCNNQIIQIITIHPLPALSIFPTIACSGSPIEFSGNELSNQTISQWTWNFGDGVSYFGQYPTYSFDTSNIYTVKLIAESNFGCIDSISQPVEIKPSPTANFINSAACTGNNVYFTNTSESLWGMQLSSSWLFDDGASSNILNPLHIFNNAGFYEVSLEVSQMANGCKNKITKNIEVNNPPTAVFFESNACVGQPHQLIDNSIPSTSPITSWRWLLNNLDFSHLQNTSITMEDTGVYPVSLIVIANNGCLDTTSKNINVHPTPNAKFNISSNLGIVSVPISFTNNTLGTNQFLWLFGNGDTSSTINPNYTYQDSGTYIIQLIATNNDNCSDTSEKELTVVFPLNDIAVLNVNSNIENDYLTCNATIANLGSLPISSANFHLKISENPEIMETWTGTLLSGTVMNYTFATKIKLDKNTEPALVCVNAEIIDSYIDINQNNNQLCYTSITEFTLLESYPNPTSDNLLIELIIPTDGVIKIDLFNADGKIIQTIYNKETIAGITRINLNTTTLANGIYTYRVEYGNAIKSKRFVKN